MKAAQEQVRAAGMQVVLDESYPPSTTDFTAVINKIISSGADAFLGGGHYADGATLARQMHDQKADLKWVSILVAPDSPKFATLGAAADGITVPSQWEPQVKYKPQFGPTEAHFTKAFEKKFKIGAVTGTPPGYLLVHYKLLDQLQSYPLRFSPYAANVGQAMIDDLKKGVTQIALM